MKTLNDYPLIIDKNDPPLCLCGCGNKVTVNKAHSNRWNVYITGHHKRFEREFCLCGCGLKVDQIYHSYIKGHNKKYPLCLCGCGEMVHYSSNTYIIGHYQNIKKKQRIIKHRKELPLCKCGCGKQVEKPSAKYYKQCYSLILQNERKKIVGESILNAPLCECGCNQKVKWKTLHPVTYNEFIQGHNNKLEENKELMREKCTKRHCPNIGSLEFQIFPKLIEVCPYKIYCLEDQIVLKDAHLDGYIKELNLVIEIDENHHESKKNQIRDLHREERIAQSLGLDVKFFRIKQKDWEEAKEIVIKSFEDLIKSLIVGKEGINNTSSISN